MCCVAASAGQVSEDARTSTNDVLDMGTAAEILEVRQMWKDNAARFLAETAEKAAKTNPKQKKHRLNRASATSFAGQKLVVLRHSPRYQTARAPGGVARHYISSRQRI